MSVPSVAAGPSQMEDWRELYQRQKMATQACNNALRALVELTHKAVQQRDEALGMLEEDAFLPSTKKGWEELDQRLEMATQACNKALQALANITVKAVEERGVACSMLDEERFQHRQEQRSLEQNKACLEERNKRLERTIKLWKASAGYKTRLRGQLGTSTQFSHRTVKEFTKGQRQTIAYVQGP